MCDTGLRSFGTPDADAVAAGLDLIMEAQQRFAGPIGGPRGRVVAAEMRAVCQLAELGLRRLGARHGLDVGAPTAAEG